MGRGEAEKLEVITGAPLSGALNSTSICSVDVEPVRVRMRTLLASSACTSGSSEEVGVRSGEVDVSVEDSGCTVGGEAAWTVAVSPASSKVRKSLPDCS